MMDLGVIELLIIGVVCLLVLLIPAAVIIGVLLYMRSRQKP